MKLKNILFFILFFCTVAVLSGQNNNRAENDSLRKMPFLKRLTYTIGGGLSLGSNFSNISLQPQVGYRVTTKLTAGIGANYQYYKYYTSVFQVYGGNTFVRYAITPKFFAQTEYQVLNYNFQTARSWNDYLLIGGGYSPGSGIFISGYYLLKYPPNNNIYGGPYIIRVGFSF